jgi:hypothetical protein
LQQFVQAGEDLARGDGLFIPAEPLFCYKLDQNKNDSMQPGLEESVKLFARKFTVSISVLAQLYFVVAGTHAAVETNAALHAQLLNWKSALGGCAFDNVAQQIAQQMSADAPWRAAVLQATNGCYEWGFYAGLYQSRALLAVRQPDAAYRALASATAYRPLRDLLGAPLAVRTNPACWATRLPAEICPDDVWQWWQSMGEACRALGRNQDAAYYLESLRSACGTNAPEYLAAVAELAVVRQSQGRLDDGLALYKEIFARRPQQPTPVWHDYIRALFHAGRFADGVAAILTCARLNGISARYLDRDFVLQDAGRYWLHFQPLDILEWYDLLGEQLAREQLTKGKEELLALLINTRALMKRVYPEYFALADDDLAALRVRLEAERTGTVARVAVPADATAATATPSGVATPNAHGESRASAANQATQRGDAWIYSAQPTNAVLEDAVNTALMLLQENIRRGVDEPAPWLALLQQFSTNRLAIAWVDGISAEALCYATLGSTYAYNGAWSNALVWLTRASGTPGLYGNTDRLGDVLVWLADMYCSPATLNTDEADYYCKWAEGLVRSNAYLWARAAVVRARLAGRADDDEQQQRLLQTLVDKGGERLQQVVYERLARAYYRAGRFREGFAAYVEGLKRTKCKMELGMWNHMFDGMFMNRSMHTADELRQIQTLLRACALRYPATVLNAPAQARLLSLADAAWIGEHIRLAEIAEQASYSDEHWLFISNCVATTPSVRAGLLYLDAHVARDSTRTNDLDWSGWITAWTTIGAEMQPGRPDSPADSGGFVAANHLLIEQLIKNSNRLGSNDAARIVACVSARMGKLSETEFDRLVGMFVRRGDEQHVKVLRARRAARK